MRRWALGILLLPLFIATGFATCSAAQPQRVAILPVYLQTYRVDEATTKVMEKALADRFHTPLASFVPVYDIIPEREVALALPVVPPRGGQKVILDQKTLLAIADKLSADIVIAAEVRQFYTDVFISWDGERIRRTSFDIRLLSYHRPSGVFFDKRDSEYYIAEDMLWGEPEYIAKKLMDALLGKVPDYRR